jgi:sec-independent protein translocase protein TatB
MDWEASITPFFADANPPLPHAVTRATVLLEVFGISFTELVLILVVALVVLGPERLPGMLRTVGLWIHKVRRITTEMRAQTGIDELLRQEGFAGGIAELRGLLRGDLRPPLRRAAITESTSPADPYSLGPALDVSRERPVEGPDAYGALPDDLIDEGTLQTAPGPKGPSEPDGAGFTPASTNAKAVDRISPEPVLTEPNRDGSDVVER